MFKKPVIEKVIAEIFRLDLILTQYTLPEFIFEVLFSFCLKLLTEGPILLVTVKNILRIPPLSNKNPYN